MRLLITGGAGTLGKAIIRRMLTDMPRTQVTVFSTDPVKHRDLQQMYPSPYLTCVLGDILDFNALRNTMAGHDMVIHAAAMKHIPPGETYPWMMYEVNVTGSRNVAQAAYELNVKKVIGISTDKACRPTTVYGCTKMMMERLFFEYASLDRYTDFHLVRYGNVFGSVGSFIYNWQRDVEAHGKIFSTVPDITRFWFSADDAARAVLKTIDHKRGTITIPMLPSLSLEKIAEYMFPDVPIEYMGWRTGGEKKHEELLTVEEAPYADYIDAQTMELFPMTSKPINRIEGAYGSEKPYKKVTKENLLRMMEGDQC